MLSFVQSWFTPVSSPIGVDFGSDCLRLAQVELIGNEHHLVAAASAGVPSHVRNDPAARFAFFAESVRDLLVQHNFRGRRVILSLPASLMHIQHLRVPKMDDEALKKGLAWEARGKLPFDPTQAVLRHLVAGEIYHDQEPKYEVILMAARRDLVDQYLAAANKARLTIAGMNVEPKATIDCFSHIYRRQSDIDATTCYVDIGCTASRATIARGGKIQFARVIPIGGEHFSRAVASALRIPLDQARQMRVQLAEASEDLSGKAIAPSPTESQETAALVAPETESLEGTGFALLNAGVAAAERREPKTTPPAAPALEAAAEPRAPTESQAAGIAADDRRKIDEACREPLSRLVEELSLCRRYFEAAFQNQPVQRLLFIGGEANQRGLCQQIAKEMGIAAQVGDPLCRMSKHTLAGVEVGIDRRVSQPGWTIAIGLSMGPAADAAKINQVESEARASR
jgi:type IV pilus assembly protein PilM